MAVAASSLRDGRTPLPAIQILDSNGDRGRRSAE